MRALLRWTVGLCSLAVIITAGVLWWAYRWLEMPIVALDAPQVVEVSRGSSVKSLARELAAKGLLDQPEVWAAWAQLTEQAHAIQAGEYQLQPGLTPRSLLELFNSGRVLLHDITFIEGSTFAEMRQLLQAHPAIENEHAHSDAQQIMQALGEMQLHPEGQFFPDTYRFARGTTDLEVLQLAHRRMQSELAAAWEARAEDLPLASAYEALILASIIEKETGLEAERARISGVFVERLRRGMRLQTDPTVIYGMMETYDGNIRRADLQRDTPYNTYTRHGLPPTPIAMPGSAALLAAVQPEITGELFFVATGKGDGSHYFSRTLAEHNAAVARYLKRLRGE